MRSTRARLTDDIAIRLWGMSATEAQTLAAEAAEALAEKVVYRDQLEQVGQNDEYGPVYREVPS